MPLSIRFVRPDDIPEASRLLLADAHERRSADPSLWPVAVDAETQIVDALDFALTAEDQPFRQIWQVAEDGGRVCGVVHSMLLPVPPIYAGIHGDPGLILVDSQAAPDAPNGTEGALVDAAERALRDAGAKIILASYVTGDGWRAAFEARRYEPLTVYHSRSGVSHSAASQARPATPADVPGIVSLSAENRRALWKVDPFWQAHPDADGRFSAWMNRSLTLADRDMLVQGPSKRLGGYVIAQPASRLHFPPAHDISVTGVIDDYFHSDFRDLEALANGGQGATQLLRAAEAAFAERGVDSVFVVCPAGWLSKRQMLQAAGYDVAMVWSLKR